MYIANRDNYLLLESIKQAKQFLIKHDLNPENVFLQKLSDKFKKTPNLVYPFVKMVYKFDDQGELENLNIGIEEILRIADWITNNKQILNRLPKNVVNYDNIEELSDDIVQLETTLKIEKFIKSLYPSMRRQVKELTDEELNDLYNYGLSFMELDEDAKSSMTPLKHYKENNIHLREYVSDLKRHIDKIDDGDEKKRVMSFINNNKDKLEIVYNRNNVIVVITKDDDIICELGSQKWCIVYSEYYRREYVDDSTTQYIIHNFNVPPSDPHSLFGITVNMGGDITPGARQDKNNVPHTLHHISELTGVPTSLFKSRTGEKYVKLQKIVDNDYKPKSIEEFEEILNLAFLLHTKKRLDGISLRKIVTNSTNIDKEEIYKIIISKGTYLRNVFFEYLFEYLYDESDIYSSIDKIINNFPELKYDKSYINLLKSKLNSFKDLFKYIIYTVTKIGGSYDIMNEENVYSYIDLFNNIIDIIDEISKKSGESIEKIHNIIYFFIVNNTYSISFRDGTKGEEVDIFIDKFNQYYIDFLKNVYQSKKDSRTAYSILDKVYKRLLPKYELNHKSVDIITGMAETHNASFLSDLSRNTTDIDQINNLVSFIEKSNIDILDLDGYVPFFYMLKYEKLHDDLRRYIGLKYDTEENVWYFETDFDFLNQLFREEIDLSEDMMDIFYQHDTSYIELDDCVDNLDTHNLYSICKFLNKNIDEVDIDLSDFDQYLSDDNISNGFILSDGTENLSSIKNEVYDVLSNLDYDIEVMDDLERFINNMEHSYMMAESVSAGDQYFNKQIDKIGDKFLKKWKDKKRSFGNNYLKWDDKGEKLKLIPDLNENFTFSTIDDMIEVMMDYDINIENFIIAEVQYNGKLYSYDADNIYVNWDKDVISNYNTYLMDKDDSGIISHIDNDIKESIIIRFDDFNN